MSDEILNDEQLDSVSGGIVITGKTPNTTYAATVAELRQGAAVPTTPIRTINRTAGTAALGALRPR